MSERDRLWDLINCLINGTYSPKNFCEEFTRIYEEEVDYSYLSYEEKQNFGEMSEMAARYSDDEGKLKFINKYFSASDIIENAKDIKLRMLGLVEIF
jgi:hypothetical protein